MKRESYLIMHKTHNALKLEMCVSGGGAHAQLGTLREDNENADVNPRELGRDVAVVVDVVDHFFLTVRNAKNSGNSIISSPLQVLEP